MLSCEGLIVRDDREAYTVTSYVLLLNKVSRIMVTMSSSAYDFYHSSSAMFLHDSVHIGLYLKALYIIIIHGCTAMTNDTRNNLKIDIL